MANWRNFVKKFRQFHLLSSAKKPESSIKQHFCQVSDGGLEIPFLMILLPPFCPEINNRATSTY